LYCGDIAKKQKWEYKNRVH